MAPARAVLACAALLALAALTPASAPAGPVAVRPAPVGDAPTAAPTPTPVADPALVDPPGEWSAWSLLDLRSGAWTGSADAATAVTNTESMVKLWIGADFIAGAEAVGRELTAGERATISAMIRHSDDDAAEELWAAGGGDPVIERLIAECGLTGTSVAPGLWSYTQITARDAVAMLRCVLDRAAHSPGTAWLVAEAREVEEPFGIPEALAPDARPAVKNGWTLQLAEDRWRVNCLAAWDGRILAVLTAYPGDLGLEHGAGRCREIARVVLR